LVWEGIAPVSGYCNQFKATYHVKNGEEATKLFVEKKLDHLWNALVNF
jgi:hypothetical protein